MTFGRASSNCGDGAPGNSRECTKASAFGRSCASVACAPVSSARDGRARHEHGAGPLIDDDVAVRRRSSRGRAGSRRACIRRGADRSRDRRRRGGEAPASAPALCRAAANSSHDSTVHARRPECRAAAPAASAIGTASLRVSRMPCGCAALKRGMSTARTTMPRDARQIREKLFS